MQRTPGTPAATGDREGSLGAYLPLYFMSQPSPETFLSYLSISDRSVPRFPYTSHLWCGPWFIDVLIRPESLRLYGSQQHEATQPPKALGV